MIKLNEIFLQVNVVLSDQRGMGLRVLQFLQVTQ